MRKLFQGWLERYLSDPEAVVLFFLVLLTFGVIIGFGSMLAPLLAAIVIAYVLEWLIDKMVAVRIPRNIAVLVVFSLFMSVLLLCLFVLMPMLWQQIRVLVNNLPGLATRAHAMILLLPEHYPGIFSAEQAQLIMDNLKIELAAFGQHVLSSSLSLIPTLIALIVYLVLVPLLVFFFLIDRRKLVNWASGFMPSERRLMRNVWNEVHEQLGNYVLGKVAEIVIVGAVTFVTFRVLHLEYTILLSMLVGFSVLIPYIGAAVATIPVAVVALLQFGWGSDFIYVLGAYAVLQGLDGNVLVPVLFSEAVNLHPIAIILAVLVFGGLWGFWGVFFAIPLAILLKALLDSWPRLESTSN